MKGFKTLVVAVALIFASSISFAGGSSSAHGWICTTNASSAPAGSAGDTADKNMAKKAKSANAAFAYAFKNCRDCTKITCDKQGS